MQNQTCIKNEQYLRRFVPFEVILENKRLFLDVSSTIMCGVSTDAESKIHVECAMISEVWTTWRPSEAL